MKYKKVSALLIAFCMIAVTDISPVCSWDYTVSYAESAVKDMGSVTLDNEHPIAKPSFSGIDASTLTWKSSDENVARVDKDGTITATGKGTCEITAVSDTVTYKITVVSEYEQGATAETEINVGNIMFTNEIVSKQMKIDAPEGTEIIYSSSDENVAVVDSEGIITAKGMGRCVITAKIGNTSYIANVTSVYTGESADTLKLGEIDLTAETPMQIITLTAVDDNTQVKWSCSDNSIAVVSAGGVVSGIKEGSCKVYAETEDKKYVIDINVYFNVEDIMQTFEIEGRGEKIKLSFSSMTDDVVYSSADKNIAVIDNDGNVTAMNIGETTIKAESTGGTVWAKIVVKELRGKIVLGDANCDGSVNIADATAIIQHIGNKDKYGLSEQGLINADVDGTEGVTGLDAVAIQMLEAGMIKTLPLIPEQ